jgi:hypothetical protein
MQLWLAIQLSECLPRREVTNTILKTREEVSLKNQLNTCLTNLENRKSMITLSMIEQTVASLFISDN